MRNSILLAVMFLVLSFPSLSFASDYMALYTKPIAESEVGNEAIGGSVERDFMSFYTSPKSADTETPVALNLETDDRYLVFGVLVTL